MPILFGFPGSMAAAVAVGWIAGSPAGALAVQRAGRSGMASAAEQRRAALLSVCVSPMFLTAAVGTGLLGSGELGLAFVRAQLAALIASGLLFKHIWRNEEEPAKPSDEQTQPVSSAPMREAVLQMLTVCGWMILFGVIARLATSLIGIAALEAPLLAFLEVTGGCAAIARLNLDAMARAVLICMTCCFGGLSIIAQSIQPLKDCRMKWHHLLGAKALQAALGGLFCYLQLRFLPANTAPVFSYGRAANASLTIAAGIVLVVAGTVLLRFNKTCARRIE